MSQPFDKNQIESPFKNHILAYDTRSNGKIYMKMQLYRLVQSQEVGFELLPQNKIKNFNSSLLHLAFY